MRGLKRRSHKQRLPSGSPVGAVFNPGLDSSDRTGHRSEITQLINYGEQYKYVDVRQ